MITDLKGRTAILTGAAGGIGTPLSRKLAALGMDLVLAGRTAAKLETLAAGLEADFGVRTAVCPGDLRDPDFPETILRCARERFGRIDVLINNAGLVHNCPVEEVTPELFDSVMQTNVRAPYFLCRGALKDLRASDCATIVNICSVVSHKGYPRQSVYAASKHALLGFSKSLANEVFSEGIRVHTISPGAVFTPMVAQARPDLSPKGMILPEDIADMVGFLLEHRAGDAVIDEICVHRTTKEPFA